MTEQLFIQHFELRRLEDGLIYTFHRVPSETATPRFAREDRPDLFIEYDPSLGWVAIDPATKAVAGRPWLDERRHHAGQPPQGEWVSKKGAKSYVYELRYLP
ncbi:MAG: hypothetical protein KF832_02140 [Caldilineaceae bacterium]|nr:hypothetical protein [Caldilineaceae bacterium]